MEKKIGCIGLSKEYLHLVIGNTASVEELSYFSSNGGSINDVCQQYNIIIILCENNFDYSGNLRLRHTLPGIHIAQCLRKAGTTLPIIFVSFLSRRQILALKPAATILSAIGSHFIKLPASSGHFLELLSNLHPLTELELQDVQLFSADNEGALNEMLHTLSSGALSALIRRGKGDETVQKLKSVVRSAYLLYGTDSSDAERTLEEKLMALMHKRGVSTLTEEMIPQAKEEVLGLCHWLAVSFAPDAKLLSVIDKPEQKPWKVLVLDDEIDATALLIQELKEYVADVICCSTADEALQALRSEDNWRSDIPVMLCDYRLLTKDIEGNTIQQPVQGYSFINQVSEAFDSRIISAVIYSGLPRRFLLKSARQLKLRCESVSKIEHRLEDPNARKYVIDTLLALGDDAHEAMLALPRVNSSVWRNLYDKLYIQHRCRPGYHNRELEIRQYCSRWATMYRKDRNPPPPSPVTFTDPSTALKDLSDVSTARYMDELMKGRRIAIWLYLRKNDLAKIGEILRKPVKSGSTPNKTYTSFLSQALALSLSDYPFGLTIEELNWLQTDMGIKAVDAYRPLRATLLETEEQISQFLATSDRLQEQIKAMNYELSGKGRKD